MLGAAALNMSPLSSRYLLNMDSEDEGVLTVSCAGGARVSFDFPITREKTVGEGLKVTLSGLTGRPFWRRDSQEPYERDPDAS